MHNKITDILKSKPQTFSAEIIPPRNGTETDVVFNQIEKLKDINVDFISVTKGAGGSLRGGTLPIAQIVQNQFLTTSLAHFTCRDYTMEEIENSLMDHHYFGIHNILALRGDPPDGQPEYFKESNTDSHRHQYAWQLVEQIKNLNSGKYLSRKGYDQGEKLGTPMKFCIGVAAHPEHEPFSEAVSFLEKKIKMGAEFAITQMIYSADSYSKFIDACQKKGIDAPILPGIRILTQKSSAERMKSKFGIPVPNKLIEDLGKVKTKEDGKKVGLEFATKLSENFVRAGAKGVHVFIMSDVETSISLFKNLQKS